MNKYIPDRYPLPQEVPLYVMAQYSALINGSKKDSIMRPVFIWNYPVWQASQYNIDQSERMTIPETMIPIITGVKTKQTKLYIEGLMAFIDKHRWVSLASMETEFFKQWMDRQEDNHLSETHRRFMALKLKANYHRRMILAYIVKEYVVLTKDNWDSAYKYLYSRPIEEYLMLMQAAIELPKQWCDDEYLNCDTK